MFPSRKARQALIRKPFVICSHVGLLEELREAGTEIVVAYGAFVESLGCNMEVMKVS